MSKRFFSDDSTRQSPPLPKLVCMASVSDLSRPSQQTEQEPLTLGTQNPSGSVFLSPASLQGDTDPQDPGSSVNTPTESSWTPSHVSERPSDVLLREILSTYFNPPVQQSADHTTQPSSSQSTARSSAPETPFYQTLSPDNSGSLLQRQSQKTQEGRSFPKTPASVPSHTQFSTNSGPYPPNNHQSQQAPVSQQQQLVPQKQKNICCLIDVLLRSPFTSLTNKQKKYVVLIGKPCLYNLLGLPLNDLTSNTWITECKSMKKYFCWPCLLFNPQNSEITYDTVQQHAFLPIHLKTSAMLEEVLKNRLVSSQQPDTNTPPPSQSAPQVPQNNLAPTSSESCIILVLVRKRFVGNWWTDQSRLEIVRRGRPCPTLKCTANPDSDLIYCQEIYSTIAWLAGCENQNKFYCWPCLLFAPNYPVFDLGATLSSSVTRQHRLSKSHMWASFTLKQWENKIDRSCQLNLLDINRESDYLKRLIDIDCFVKTCSSDTGLDSLTIAGLMDQVISADDALQRQIRERSNSEYAVRIADVSACLQHVISERIRKEVADAPYVALILEDVANVVDKSFIATFICYVSEKGDLCERFLRFDCIGFDRSSKTILNLATKVLVEFDLEIARKLVGITYGGTVLDPFHAKQFHKDLGQVCPWAEFFNFGGHDLKKIILQSLSHTPKLRYFIQSLNIDFEMPLNVPQLFEHYDKDMLQKIMKDQGSQWFFMCLAANYKVLAKRYDDLGSSVVANPVEESRLFKSVDTQFLIVLLAKIFSKVNDLIAALNTSQMRTAISQFVLSLLTIEAEGYNAILDDAKKMMVVKTDPDQTLDLTWFRETFDITLKYVSEVVMFRTEENDLTALRGYISSFETSKDNIAEILRRSNFQFHIEKLMNQMDFTNRTNFFTDKTPTGLIRSIFDFRMADSLSELHRFLRLVIVTSASDYDEESSSVKKLGILTKQNRSLFSNLSYAQIRIESSLLLKLQEESSFYTDCFECFKNIVEKQGLSSST